MLEKDSEGTQWIVFTDGCECRIVFPDAKTKADFDSCTSDSLSIRSLSGDHFKSLFRKVTLSGLLKERTFAAR